jgi:uncharacterized protein YutE (UPF0331/DUF86 family)
VNTDERWTYLAELDEQLLKGGVVLSEKSAFLVRNADLAFVHEAHLAAVLTAVAAIETHLSAEDPYNRQRLVGLIDSSALDSELKAELHALRKFRNSWVHVDDPWDDGELLEQSNDAERHLEEMASRAVVALRKTIYSNPWI